MPIVPDPVESLEKSIAARLAPLEDWRVQLFADEPGLARSPAASTLYIGHNVTNYEPVENDVVIIYRETATFLFQMTTTDMRSHHKCMRYMGTAIREIARYKPFALIDAFVPVRYGDPRLLEEDGLWLFTGVVTASWNNLPRDQPLEPPVIIIPDSISFGAYLGPSGELFKRKIITIEYQDDLG